MTDIDPLADISIGYNDGDMTVWVRMLLTGPVTHQWEQRYQALARAKDVPARVVRKPDKAWILVTIPVHTEHADVLTAMDATRALAAEADAAVTEQSPAAQTQAIIREWWARQQS